MKRAGSVDPALRLPARKAEPVVFNLRLPVRKAGQGMARPARAALTPRGTLVASARNRGHVINPLAASPTGFHGTKVKGRIAEAPTVAERFPPHVASGCIGHNVAVAVRHYPRVAEEHLQLAVQKMRQKMRHRQRTKRAEATRKPHRPNHATTMPLPMIAWTCEDGPRSVKRKALVKVGDTGLEPVTPAV
jgi:hypothetical protein